MIGELYPGEFEVMEHNGRMDALEQEPKTDCISISERLPEERMTIEEVIKELSVEYLGDSERIIKAKKMAIKTLEQEPCPNAISRSDMLDAVGHGTTYTSEELQKIIRALPPVNPLAKDYNTVYYTPQPKTGHWIFDEILDMHYYCSECKSMGVDYWDFCPYCGAKMIEPPESEG